MEKLLKFLIFITTFVFLIGLNGCISIYFLKTKKQNNLIFSYSLQNLSNYLNKNINYQINFKVFSDFILYPYSRHEILLTPTSILNMNYFTNSKMYKYYLYVLLLKIEDSNNKSTNKISDIYLLNKNLIFKPIDEIQYYNIILINKELKNILSEKKFNFNNNYIFKNKIELKLLFLLKEKEITKNPYSLLFKINHKFYILNF